MIPRKRGFFFYFYVFVFVFVFVFFLGRIIEFHNRINYYTAMQLCLAHHFSII